MFHERRHHRVAPVETVDDLVEKLTRHSWTTCAGFSWGSLTLLNDSTGPDGAQEFVVVRGGREIESLTVSWMDAAELRECLLRYDAQGSGIDLGPAAVRPHPEGEWSCCA